ncbi:MAG: hypothetical protein Q7U76_11240 [Nitrospirota bacterium]|nr:hypothetical protein [Nitrospirota bacterium]
MNRAPVLKFPQPELRSFSVDPKTKEVVIRVFVGDALCADVVNTLQALEGLVGHLRMIQESCYRQVKSDVALEQRKRRHIEIARTYQRLRLSGLKHRAAINSIFIDPAFSDLQASTANIAWWVKAYGLSSKPEEPS